jgi:hypothetical protein
MWEDSTNLYTFINFIIILLEHTLEMFLTLQHFLEFLVIWERKGYIVSWAKMHTIEFLKVVTKKNQSIVNLTMHQR